MLIDADHVEKHGNHAVQVLEMHFALLRLLGCRPIEHRTGSRKINADQPVAGHHQGLTRFGQRFQVLQDRVGIAFNVARQPDGSGCRRGRSVRGGWRVGGTAARGDDVIAASALSSPARSIGRPR